MKTKQRLVVVFIALALFACRPAREGPTVAPAAPTMAAGLPNPASVNCEEQGGTLVMREEESGQRGICLFADGSECDEWAFFRGECAPGTPPPTPTVASDPPPAPPTPSPAATGTPVATAGWLSFTRPSHGFSFNYPPDWTVEEDLRPQSTAYRHLLWLKPSGQTPAVLTIGFRRADELDVGIQRTGVGAGDLLDSEPLLFLGEPLARTRLVLGEKTMAVLYGRGAEITRGDLRFALSLDYIGEVTDEAALGSNVQATADAIVRSFQQNP